MTTTTIYLAGPFRGYLFPAAASSLLILNQIHQFQQKMNIEILTLLVDVSKSIKYFESALPITHY